MSTCFNRYKIYGIIFRYIIKSTIIIMHKHLKFAVENFELYNDGYDSQIHTKGRSILVSRTYKFWLKKQQKNNSYIQQAFKKSTTTSTFNKLSNFLKTTTNNNNNNNSNNNKNLSRKFKKSILHFKETYAKKIFIQDEKA